MVALASAASGHSHTQGQELAISGLGNKLQSELIIENLLAMNVNLNGFLTNKVDRTQYKHLLNIISSAGVAGRHAGSVGCWDAEGIFPNASKISHEGTYFPTTESDLMQSLTNEVCRIHEGYVLDVISSTGVTGGKGWPMGCWDIASKMGKLLVQERFPHYAPSSEVISVKQST